MLKSWSDLKIKVELILLGYYGYCSRADMSFSSVLVSTWSHHICRTPWDSTVISPNRPDTKLCEGLVDQSVSFALRQPG